MRQLKEMHLTAKLVMYTTDARLRSKISIVSLSSAVRRVRASAS